MAPPSTYSLTTDGFTVTRGPVSCYVDGQDVVAEEQVAVGPPQARAAAQALDGQEFVLLDEEWRRRWGSGTPLTPSSDGRRGRTVRRPTRPRVM